MITDQILTGLAHVHDQYCSVHRDIKPGNILINNKNKIEVKIGDFGLIKNLEAFNPDKSSPTLGQGENPFQGRMLLEEGLRDNELLDFKLENEEEYEFELQIEETKE